MSELNQIIQKFSNQKILVIGDIMLDEYIYGDVSRINPEAPVPILNVTKTEQRLGGAANVANNIVSLGGQCTLIGQVGDDEEKEELIKELEKKAIKYFLISTDNYKTIKKTRVVSENQQFIRIDKETRHEINQEHIDGIIEHIKENGYKAILIPDYNKGMVTKELMDRLKILNVKIISDPKPYNIELFKDTFLISPNLKEGKEVTNEEVPERIGRRITETLNTNLILTCGKEGAYLFEKDINEHTYLPTKAKEIFDVSGAGDTFISTIALAVTTGASLYDSVILGNYAAGIVVGKFGTSTITCKELSDSFSKKTKVKTQEELQAIIENLKENDKKIVFTNGCFDILHVGHTKLIKKAKSFGDTLILGLNTDYSIKLVKGENRPINSQEERAEVLAAIEDIDYIVFFGEETPCNLIKALKPDIHVKGGDYDPEKIPEAEIIKEYGGEIKIVDLFKDKSTTHLIEKIKNGSEDPSF